MITIEDHHSQFHTSKSNLVQPSLIIQCNKYFKNKEIKNFTKLLTRNSTINVAVIFYTHNIPFKYNLFRITMQRVANPLSKSMDYDLVRITVQRVASPLSKTMVEIVHEEMPPPSAHSLEGTRP